MVHDTTFIKHGKAWVDCLKAAEAEPRPGLGAYHGHGRSEHLPPPAVGIRVLKPFPEPRPTNHCSEGQAADAPQHSEHANQSPGGRNVASRGKQGHGGAFQNHQNRPGARRACDDRCNHRPGHDRTQEHLPSIRQGFKESERENHFRTRIPTVGVGRCSLRPWPWYAPSPGRGSASAALRQSTQALPCLMKVVSWTMRTTIGPSGQLKGACPYWHAYSRLRSGALPGWCSLFGDWACWQSGYTR